METGFEILCWGDGLYLWRVLNGLAMLSGSGNLAKLALTGCIIGLTLACIRAVTSGGREFPLVQVVLGAVMYIALFGVSVPVIITPQHTSLTRTNVTGANLNPGGGAGSGGASMVVDNVPWGAAITGTVLSQAGVKLTSLFETIFSTPSSVGVTNGGLAKTLSYLTAVRLLAQPYVSSAPSAGGPDDAAFYQWRRSLSAYIHDCTIGGLNSPSGAGAASRIFTDADPMAGIKFDSSVWYTVTYLESDLQAQKSCTEAHELLTAKAGDGRLNRALNGLMSARYGLAPEGGVQAVSDALAAVGSIASADMQRYMMATVVNAVWSDALLDGPRLAGDVTSIMALRQAEEQRASDWVGGANLFLSSLRPVLSFFEALTYAIAPFLVFMLGLGERGWKVLGSYFLLALWVQLWLPILAICNLYLLTSMEHVVAGLTHPATSVVGVNEIQMQGLHWLALGSMFVQITPFLALALLYGGAVTATTLAGRMAGQDYYNEKAGTPDALAPAPALQMGAQFAQTQAGGVLVGGAKTVQFTPQTGQSETVSSARTVHEQAMESAVHRASVIAGHNATWAQQFSIATTGSDGTEVSGSTSAQSTLQDSTGNTVSQSQGAGMSVQSSEAIRSGGTLGLGTGSAATARASYGAETNQNWGESGHRSKDASTTHGVSASESETVAAQQAHRIATSITAMQSSGGMEGISVSDAEELSKIASDVRSADESYSKVVASTAGMSSSQPMGAEVAGSNFLKHVDPAQQDAAYRLMESSEFRGTYESVNQQLKQSMPDPVERRAAATVMVLGRLGAGETLPDLSPEMEAERLRQVANTFDRVFPGSAPSTYASRDARENGSLEDDAPRYGTPSEAAEPLALPRTGDNVWNAQDNVRERVESGTADAGGTILSGARDEDGVMREERGEVESAHASHLAEAQRANREERQRAGDAYGRISGEIIEDNKGVEPYADAMESAKDTVKGWFGGEKDPAANEQ